MKKVIVLATIFTLFGVSITYGAIKAQEIKSWDFIAQVQTLNKGNIMLYKVIDGDNTCYIGASDDSKWNPQVALDCVKTK